MIHHVFLFTLCSDAQSCPTLCNPMDCAHQAPLSMGFSSQEYWSGCHFPPPGDLLDLRIEPASLTSPVLAGRLFTPSSTWEVIIHAIRYQRLMRWYQNCWLHLQVVSLCLSLLMFFDEKKSTPATSKNICLCLVSRQYCQTIYSGFIIMKIVYLV